jgi:hypothetical protein
MDLFSNIQATISQIEKILGEIEKQFPVPQKAPVID